MTYASAAHDLHDFFVLAGTGSAALVGLLFVGLSLHLRTVVAAPEIRALARVTLSNFGTVLFASMFMVLDQTRVAAGSQLIGTGLVSVVVAGPAILSAFRSPRLTPDMSRGTRVRVVLRFVLSGAGFAGVIASGFLLLASQIETFVTVMEIVTVGLLLISLRNTWDLLVTVGDVVVDSEGTRP